MSQQIDPHNEKLSALLKLKRYEQPDLGYFDRFADEFRAAENERMSQPGIFGSLVGRVRGIGAQLEARPRMAFTSAVAYAAIALAAVATLHRGMQNDGVAAEHSDLLLTPVSLTAPKQVVVPVIENVSKNELKRQEAEKKAAESK